MTNQQIFNNTQKQFQLEEKLLILFDDIIEAIELLEAKATRFILDNEFEAAECIIDRLAIFSKLLVGAAQ